jgi:hypothetical protein
MSNIILGAIEVPKIDFLTDYRSSSLYSVWLNAGYEGTIDDFMLFLEGENGLSAYEIAVENGFDGTVEEWLLSLQGKDGDTPTLEAVDTYLNIDRTNGATDEFLNEKGEFVKVAQGGGQGLAVYLTDTPDAVIPNYKQLSYALAPTETELLPVVNNNEVYFIF